VSLVRFCLAMCFTAASASCCCTDVREDQRVLVATPVELGPVPLELRPDSPLRGIGPINEVCLLIPSDYALGAPTGPDQLKVRGPNGFVVLSVVLIDSAGGRTNVPVIGLRDRREICFVTREPRDLSRRYVGLAISADAPLRILRVRWRAGHRYPSW